MSTRQQLRELTDCNVAEARVADGQFMVAMVRATIMWLDAMPSNETTPGLK